MSVKTDCFDGLIAALKAALPVGFNPSRICYPNAPFERPTPNPTPQTAEEQLAEAWLEVVMEDVANTPQSPCRQLNSGILSIDVYWPKLTGNKAANNFADVIKKALAQEWIGALKINLGVSNEFDSKDWYNINVSFDYSYEENVK